MQYLLNDHRIDCDDACLIYIHLLRFRIVFQVDKYIFRHLVEIIRINKHNLKTLIYPHLHLAQLRCDI